MWVGAPSSLSFEQEAAIAIQDCWPFAFPANLPLGFPQAFDTATHALIIRDMLRWDEESAGGQLRLRRTLLIVAVVWAMHAMANLVG